MCRSGGDTWEGIAEVDLTTCATVHGECLVLGFVCHGDLLVFAVAEDDGGTVAELADNYLAFLRR